MFCYFKRECNEDNNVDLSARDIKRLHRFGKISVKYQCNMYKVTFKKIINGMFHCVFIDSDSRGIDLILKSPRLYRIKCGNGVLKSSYFLSKLETLAPDCFLDFRVRESSIVEDACRLIMQKKIVCRNLKICISAENEEQSKVIHAMIDSEGTHLEHLKIFQRNYVVNRYFHTALKRVWLKTLEIGPFPQSAYISRLTNYYAKIRNQRYIELLLYYHKILPKDLIVFLRDYLYVLPLYVLSQAAE